MPGDKPEGYVFGRPTLYRPEYCEVVIEAGKEGKSRVEIADDLDVDRTTIDNWAKAHPDFFRALARAKDAEQAWWERQGRTNITAQHFQSSMWSRSMAARFPDDWREKQDMNLNGTLQVTEIKRTIVDPRDSDA